MSNANFSSSFFVRLNDGGESAFERVDRQFRSRLCFLVARMMGNRFASREDHEDPVQSALRSFYRGIGEKRFRITSSVVLWRLLVAITRNKVLQHVEYHLAKKRSPEHEVATGGGRLAVREVDVVDTVHISDLIDRVLDGLRDPDPEIFRLRLEGYTRAEIARRVNCTEAAVRIKLDRMRDRLRRLLAKDEDKGQVCRLETQAQTDYAIVPA